MCLFQSRTDFGPPARPLTNISPALDPIGAFPCAAIRLIIGPAKRVSPIFSICKFDFLKLSKFDVRPSPGRGILPESVIRIEAKRPQRPGPKVGGARRSRAAAQRKQTRCGLCSFGSVLSIPHIKSFVRSTAGRQRAQTMTHRCIWVPPFGPP